MENHKFNKSRERLRRNIKRTIGGTVLALSFFVASEPAAASAPIHEFTPPIAPTSTFNESPPPQNYDLYGSELSPVYENGFTRDTGMDSQACEAYEICGTDLGQPFLMPDGSIGYLFGDTFKVPGPFLKNVEGGDNYRAQAMLVSRDLPKDAVPINFSGAGGLETNGKAGDLLDGWHMLVNDGVSLPNGDIIISYQHTFDVENGDHSWYTDYSSLAISHDNGQTFEKLDIRWGNDPLGANDDPYQMWSMQLDGDYVDIVSVRSGRRTGDMMLFRVPWDKMVDKSAYEYWDGEKWGEQSAAKPIDRGHFGEPSLRKISDGTWVLEYADYWGYPKLVTRTLKDNSSGPAGEWNKPKVQVTSKDLPNPYGGGVHPYSTKDNLIMMVSTWQTSGTSKAISERQLKRYDVSHYITNLGD